MIDCHFCYTELHNHSQFCNKHYASIDIETIFCAPQCMQSYSMHAQTLRNHLPESVSNTHLSEECMTTLTSSKQGRITAGPRWTMQRVFSRRDLIVAVMTAACVLIKRSRSLFQMPDLRNARRRLFTDCFSLCFVCCTRPKWQKDLRGLTAVATVV